MKVKTLMATAIICGMSIFGINVTSAAAYNLQTTQIETQQLSQKVRDRNTAIATVAGIAAIAAIANHNEKHHNSYHEDNHRKNHKHTPPPPPHHRR